MKEISGIYQGSVFRKLCCSKKKVTKALRCKIERLNKVSLLIVKRRFNDSLINVFISFVQ